MPQNAKETDALWSAILALIATWLVCNFLMNPLCQAFWDRDLPWWAWILVFFYALGAAGAALAKDRTTENQAYPKADR